MREQMLAKFSNSFLFLAVGFLMLFSPFIGKAQNNGSKVECKWVTESATEFYYSGITGRYEPRYVTKQVYKCVAVSSESNSTAETDSTNSRSVNNPTIVRNADGTFSPPDGYRWVYSKEDPNVKELELMPNLTIPKPGQLRPAKGYQWVNPKDSNDFRVKLMPGLVKTEDGLRPDKGYRWINPNDPNDLRVERIP